MQTLKVTPFLPSSLNLDRVDRTSSALSGHVESLVGSGQLVNIALLEALLIRDFGLISFKQGKVSHRALPVLRDTDCSSSLAIVLDLVLGVEDIAAPLVPVLASSVRAHLIEVSSEVDFLVSLQTEPDLLSPPEDVLALLGLFGLAASLDKLIRALALGHSQWDSLIFGSVRV